jgi:hypothetical protein
MSLHLWEALKVAWSRLNDSAGVLTAAVTLAYVVLVYKQLQGPYRAFFTAATGQVKGPGGDEWTLTAFNCGPGTAVGFVMEARFRDGRRSHAWDKAPPEQDRHFHIPVPKPSAVFKVRGREAVPVFARWRTITDRPQAQAWLWVPSLGIARPLRWWTRSFWALRSITS